MQNRIWDFDIMKNIFDKMWLKQKAYQETKREILEMNWEIEFMIDIWPWLNPFIEVEFMKWRGSLKICKIIMI